MQLVLRRVPEITDVGNTRADTCEYMCMQLLRAALHTAFICMKKILPCENNSSGFYRPAAGITVHLSASVHVRAHVVCGLIHIYSVFIHKHCLSVMNLHPIFRNI